MKTILVLGGTGQVGSEVVRELLGRQVAVRILSREPENQPTPEKVERVVGDLDEVATIERIFDGVDGVFVLTALGPSECHQGLMAVNGAREAGVAKVVYLSVHRVEEAPHLPHFGAKIPVEMALKASDLSWTILRPNNFYQNDLWLREALLGHGVYPQPIGSIGQSRVDVRDIAAIAAMALTESGEELAGQTLDLVGPRPWTGEETAALWQEALKRPIQYVGNDLDVWQQGAEELMPDWMVYDLRRMYRHFLGHGLLASEHSVEELAGVLGRSPLAYEDFVRSTAARWSAD